MSQSYSVAEIAEVDSPPIFGEVLHRICPRIISSLAVLAAVVLIVRFYMELSH